MSTRIVIDDDGDEQVFFRVNEEIIGVVDHELYGWAGMEGAIKLVKDLAEATGVEVYDFQGIV